MLEQTTDYNKLIPPSNPEYPWIQKEWQPLCYYCAQPIEPKKPEAGYRQRANLTWIHVDGKYNCDKSKIRPTEEIDDPRCGCCRTQTKTHLGFCSHAGKPPCSARSMSDKEHEIIEMFGWSGSENKIEKTNEFRLYKELLFKFIKCNSTELDSIKNLMDELLQKMRKNI